MTKSKSYVFCLLFFLAGHLCFSVDAVEQVEKRIPPQEITNSGVSLLEYKADKDEKMNLFLFLYLKSNDHEGNISLVVKDRNIIYNAPRAFVNGNSQKFHFSGTITMNRGKLLGINYTGSGLAWVPEYPKSRMILIIEPSEALAGTI